MSLDGAEVAFYEDIPYASVMTFDEIKRIVRRMNRAFVSFSLAGDEVEKKIALLKIYRSQIGQRELDMVREYHVSRGSEHLWATRPVLEEIKSLSIAP